VAAASVSARTAAIALAFSAAVAAVSTARACGYHDPSGYSAGMLNWAYPDALHVRTAVWMAQRDGVLARTELPAVDPASAQARLLQPFRLRATQARLDALRDALDAAVDGRSAPPFAIVLVGPMLWTRFEAADEGLRMASHVPGPTPEDVVIVTDEPVVAALVDGHLGVRELHRRGLVRLYGGEQAVGQVSALLDQLAGLQDDDVVPTHR
jgi:hypothetical protein